jgi:hypothetical protein
VVVIAPPTRSARTTALAAQYNKYEPLPGLHVNGKLTLAPNTNVNVQLQLQQPVVTGDAASPYGVDARDATLQLPDQLFCRPSGLITLLP